MKITEFLQENRVFLDGGTGTLLQSAGLPLGELPERWNCTHADTLVQIHKDYFDVGCHVVCTNTFGANALKFTEEELAEVIRSAVANAKRARELSVSPQEKYIALDVGPLGKLLKPYGDLGLEEAIACFAKTVKMGVQCGVDLIYIETMGDSLETKAAVLAAKENSDLPVFVSCVYGEDGKLMTGASPEAMVALLEGLKVDALGANCSLGPKQLAPVVERLLACSSLPVLVKPNAGLPTPSGGYDVGEEEFAKQLATLATKGAHILGGCCGTTPEYLRATVAATREIPLLPSQDKGITCVSSYTHAVDFAKPVLIGERINPTGKKRFQQALKDKDVGYVLAEGIAQQEKGVHILDVNVGTPAVDEKRELPRYIEELQAVIDLPLQIDTSDTVAMEKAMRVYNGKPLINSVNGKKESMEEVFPLIQKYGGVVVALTLDEEGIPDTVEKRVQIAEKIIGKAKEYGIAKKDILVDPLAMAVSAARKAASITLQTVEALTKKGIQTSLGVSNVSFGLPDRGAVNAVFFAQALSKGLSAAILNPYAEDMLKAYYAHLALSGQDENCLNYIAFATPAQKQEEVGEELTLQRAIQKGLSGKAAELTTALLRTSSPMEIINGDILPALDSVGRAYEEKRAFLPQLLMSAEGAKAAFDVLKKHLASEGKQGEKGAKILLATVQGDIHDIGKNIVGTLLENYGYDVVDLGRDVPPEVIAEEAIRQKAPFVGLSALMTTTLPSMERTVKLVKEKAPWAKILVGGAVVSKDYAERIGADGYGKDAMATVRVMQTLQNMH